MKKKKDLQTQNNGELQVSDAKMKKAMNKTVKDILMCVVVLTLIAVTAGTVLGVVNYFTYVDPDEAIIKKISENYNVEQTFVKKQTDESFIKNVDGSKSYVSGCYILYDKNVSETTKDAKMQKAVYRVVGSGAYKGTLELVVYVDVATSKIDKVIVYKHSETPAPGGKVLKQERMNMYVGKDLSKITDYKLATSKNDLKEESIYIAGATYTSRAIVNAVRATAYCFNNTIGGAK